MTLDRNVKLLFWFNFFLELKFYNAILVIYIAHVTGSYAMAMGIFAAASWSGALFELPTGVFSDLVGRKWTVVLGAVAHAAAVLFYAIGGDYALFLLGGIVEGLARALFSGNNAALLHDTLAESGQEALYGDVLGRTTAMEHMGAAGAALFGAILAALTSFALVMWVSVLPQIVLIGVALGFREPRVLTAPATGNPLAHVRAALRLLRQNVRLRWLGAASMFGYGIGEAAYQLQAAFIEMLWPLWAVGAVRMLNNVLAAVGFYFSGPVIRRWSEFRVLIGGGMIERIAGVLAYALPTVASPLLLSSTSMLYGVQSVAHNSLMQRDFTTEQRATLGSLVAFGGSILFGMLSVVVGAIADRVGLVTLLLGAQIVQFVPLWMIGQALRARKTGMVLEEGLGTGK